MLGKQVQHLVWGTTELAEEVAYWREVLGQYTVGLYSMAVLQPNFYLES